MSTPEIFQCKTPAGKNSDAVFDEEYERRDIPEGATQVWYWYERGDYEGSGEALVRFGEDGWGVDGMSHCSCYGPTDDLSSCEPAFATLEELTDGYTTERRAEFKPLQDAAETWLAAKVRRDMYDK